MCLCRRVYWQHTCRRRGSVSLIIKLMTGTIIKRHWWQPMRRSSITTHFEWHLFGLLRLTLSVRRDITEDGNRTIQLHGRPCRFDIYEQWLTSPCITLYFWCRQNTVWHKEKGVCGPTDPWVNASNSQTQADFFLQNDTLWYSEARVWKHTLWATWEEKKMHPGLILNPGRLLSSKRNDKYMIWFFPASLSLPLSLHWSVWNPKHNAHLINKPFQLCTNLCTS